MPNEALIQAGNRLANIVAGVNHMGCIWRLKEDEVKNLGEALEEWRKAVAESGNGGRDGER